MKQRFETWNHFTLVKDNQHKAKCNYFDNVYQCHSNYDEISNMGTHLKVREAHMKVK